MQRRAGGRPRGRDGRRLGRDARSAGSGAGADPPSAPVADADEAAATAALIAAATAASTATDEVGGPYDRLRRRGLSTVAATLLGKEENDRLRRRGMVAVPGQMMEWRIALLPSSAPSPVHDLYCLNFAFDSS